MLDLFTWDKKEMFKNKWDLSAMSPGWSKDELVITIEFRMPDETKK